MYIYMINFMYLLPVFGFIASLCAEFLFEQFKFMHHTCHTHIHI